jgi:hypothetical protein
MADIAITDNVDLNADLKIRDDPPLAKAKLTQLVTTTKQLFADFGKPIDQSDLQSVALGGTFTSPNLLNSDVTNLSVSAGMNCGFEMAASKAGSRCDDAIISALTFEPTEQDGSFKSALISTPTRRGLSYEYRR